MGLVVNSPPASIGDTRQVGSIPGSGRSPGGRHGSPLQHSCLENPKHRGAWRAAVRRVAKTATQLERLSPHNTVYMQDPIFPSRQQWRGIFALSNTFPVFSSVLPGQEFVFNFYSPLSTPFSLFLLMTAETIRFQWHLSGAVMTVCRLFCLTYSPRRFLAD